jgi:ubiquinone/menaquinone biosynthesis C-methylase UbiE
MTIVQQRQNRDDAVIAGFGDEWSTFTQAELSESDRAKIFGDYFADFPWNKLPKEGAVGVDIGCGSGRWAAAVAPRVALLHCVDASGRALEVARQSLRQIKNVRFHESGVDDMPFADGTLDFAYSLGVLHHVPDTQAALYSVASKLKPGSPFLVYLYYAFDNRPFWFRLLWRISDSLRRAVSRLPLSLRLAISQSMAVLVYWPLARVASWLEYHDRLPDNWPLAYYRDKSFYVMRTDALDRFGTRLEYRFTQEQIREMLISAGFRDIRFRDSPPYWCAIAVRR